MLLTLERTCSCFSEVITLNCVYKAEDMRRTKMPFSPSLRSMKTEVFFANYAVLTKMSSRPRKQIQQNYLNVILKLCILTGLATCMQVTHAQEHVLMTITTSATPTEYIIRNLSYPLEIHNTTTDDGYILTLHRIPQKNQRISATTKKTPIVMVAGFFGDSFIFVCQGEQGAPAFVFSDAGYDVWLVNNRGSRYSRHHVTLDPNTDKKFWNFSFSEMGTKDMPAIVDYVLSASGAQQLYLVGFSMGGDIVSVFLAKNTSYSQKVKAVYLWSPAFKLGKADVPHMSPIYDALLDSFHDMGIDALSQNKTIPFLPFSMKLLFNTYKILFCETHKDEIPNKVLFKLLELSIAGTSVKNCRHIIQLHKRNEFAEYDYGSAGNKIEYGQERPPVYNLSLIQVPIRIVYSEDDAVVNANDLLETTHNYFSDFRMMRITRTQGMKPFLHRSYLYSSHLKQLVCDPMLNDMAKLETTLYET